MRHGGTWRTHAFQHVVQARTFLRAAPDLRLIAPGGLSPGNVKRANADPFVPGRDVVIGPKVPPEKGPRKGPGFSSARHREAAATMLLKTMSY